MGKDEETEELIDILLIVSKLFGKNRNSYSRFDIGYLKTNEIK